MWTYNAHLVRVIDGDTYVLNIDLGFHIWIVEHIRLAGIDTPERGTPGGSEVMLFVRNWFVNNDDQVLLTTTPAQVKTFDRWVGEVSAGTDNLADALRLAGHYKAVPGA